MKTIESAARSRGQRAWIFADRGYWALILGLPALASVLPIASGFWLDETGTYWLIRGGISEIAQRCMILPQSMLYTALMWAIDRVAGHSEIVFRVPSVFAIFAASYLIFRLARDEFGHEVGLTAAALFASTPAIIFAACDARPYALGLLSATAASLALLQWAHTGRLLYGLAYAVAASLIIHFHFLFAPVLVAHALYVLLGARRRRIRSAQVAAVVLCFAALIAPLAPQFIELARTRVARTYADRPDAADLVFALAPVFVAIPALVALLVVVAGSRVSRPQHRMSPLLVVFVLAWAVVPPAVLWGISVAGATHLFVPRFLVSAAPGTALLFALLLASPKSLMLRRFLLAFAVATGLFGAYSGEYLFNHGGKRGDYRAALAFVERQTAADSAPVLIRSQYIESDFVKWRGTQIDTNVLFSPLGYYPTNARFVPLPLSMTPEVEECLREFAAEANVGRRRFLLMSFTGPRPLPPFLHALRASLPGWRNTQIANFRGILVYDFRPPVSPDRAVPPV